MFCAVGVAPPSSHWKIALCETNAVCQFVLCEVKLGSLASESRRECLPAESQIVHLLTRRFPRVAIHYTAYSADVNRNTREILRVLLNLGTMQVEALIGGKMKLAEMRKRAGVSQVDLAKHVKKSDRTIQS